MSASIARLQTRSSAVTSLLALVAGLVAIMGLFWPECHAAVGVWMTSTAYGHCFLVAPIAAYLAWDRQDSLRDLMPRPSPALVLLGAPLPLVWLAAERLGIMEGRQLVVVAIIEVLFLSVLGWQLFQALMGPLLYLFFLVPFGAFITPALQSFTAHFIDIGLGVIGIPHFVTDMTIEISAGIFYVAEACAGLRFLIASMAFGVFFALLNYNSPGRRAAFIAASIAIPVVANGLRALGIVVLGNVLGSAEAAAADHIIYGWAFFSVVMLLLIAAGLPFREAPKPAMPHSPSQTRFDQPWAAALVVAMAAIGPATAMALDSRAVPAHLSAQPTLVAPAGCKLTPEREADAASAAFMMACPARTWTITLQSIPARSTGAVLAEAKRRLIGPVDSDEAITATLAKAPGWQSIMSREPPQVTGIAAWVDGQPVTGGMAQRLLQARNSIADSSFSPAVMVITSKPNHPVSEAEIRAMVAELTGIVTAQPNLTAQIARLTGPSAVSRQP